MQGLHLFADKLDQRRRWGHLHVCTPKIEMGDRDLIDLERNEWRVSRQMREQIGPMVVNLSLLRITVDRILYGIPRVRAKLLHEFREALRRGSPQVPLPMRIRELPEESDGGSDDPEPEVISADSAFSECEH